MRDRLEIKTRVSESLQVFLVLGPALPRLGLLAPRNGEFVTTAVPADPISKEFALRAHDVPASLFLAIGHFDSLPGCEEEAVALQRFLCE
jgi:hypothetical protein